MTIMPVLTFTEQVCVNIYYDIIIRFIFSFFKGVYEIVNNMGSLAARFIFRPIEDSGYFYFTQMVKRDKMISDQNPVSIHCILPYLL